MTAVAHLEGTQVGGGKLRQEVQALVSGCAVYRLDRALFSLTGRDRVRWLNSMVSNNVRDLPSGHGVYAFVLTAQGQIQGDLYVFNRGESLIMSLERAQIEKLLPLLRRYIIMDKVEIEDLSDKTAVVGLAGPKSGEVLASAGLSGNLGNLEFSDAEWNESSVTVVRGDNSSFPSYELWVSAERAESSLELLRRAGAEEVHAKALETFRILCGIPKVGQDIGDRTLPQETGQDRALNFTKGCYIGQEIVERIRARGAVHRMFIGFEIHGDIPPAGTKIQSEGKDVGEITSVMAAPLKGKRLALGYVRRELIGSDKTLTASSASIKIKPLPFTDAFS